MNRYALIVKGTAAEAHAALRERYRYPFHVKGDAKVANVRRTVGWRGTPEDGRVIVSSLRETDHGATMVRIHTDGDATERLNEWFTADLASDVYGAGSLLYWAPSD